MRTHVTLRANRSLKKGLKWIRRHQGQRGIERLNLVGLLGAIIELGIVTSEQG